MRPLPEAIERLYQAFSTVPKPRHIDGCPHCIEYKRVDVLMAMPLRELTPDDLRSYASSAFLTVGDVADYLYFLPRILEIQATEFGWWPTPEVTGAAVRKAKPEDWTAEQRSALTDDLESVVGAAIQAEDGERLDEWLCAIAAMGFDVRPYLDEVAKQPVAMLKYFDVNADDLPLGKLSNPFWEDTPAAHDAVVNWFFSPEIAKIPAEAYGCTLVRAERQ